MAGSPGKDALYKAVESGDYCDLRLRLSDDSELKVHRVVLCTQCEFFANAIKPGRFLANSSVIDMRYDPPQAIRRLVEFLYTGRYIVKGPENSDTNEPTPRAAGLDLPPNEYAKSVLAHADVYVISKLYEVPKLEEEACNAIKSALEEPETLKVFPRVVQIIYSGIPEATCAIHGDLFHYAQSHLAELIQGDQFQNMIQIAPILIGKLMRHLVSSNVIKTEQLLWADNDIKRLQDEAEDLQGRISLDKISLQDKDDKVKGLEEEVKGLEEEVKGLEEEVKGLEEKVKGLQDKLKDLRRYKCPSCAQIFGVYGVMLPARVEYLECSNCGHWKPGISWADYAVSEPST